METNEPLKICFDRVIPEHLDPQGAHHHEAQVTHAQKALGNKKVFEGLDPEETITGVRLAVIRSKAWPDGHRLKCRFLDGTPVQRQRVMQCAKKWEAYADIHIDFVDTMDEQVRIAFMPGQGSWSAVGTDALNAAYFPKHQPTMNFGWLVDNTEDKEYDRVVIHEFGHALGCVHEHQSPTATLKWNVAEVYRAFAGPPNYWKKEEIDHNILRKYSPAGVEASLFDEESIMLYQFPAQLFTDLKGTKENTVLSPMDKQMIGSMYPR